MERAGRAGRRSRRGRDQLKKAVAEVEAAFKKDQHRLRAYQATGRFDKGLLDRVNAEREQLKELEREAERRGVR